MTQHWWMQFPLCPWGWMQGVAPAIALHIACTWRGNPPIVIVALAVAVAIAIAVAISVIVADSVTIAVAVAHCHCRWPLPLQLPSTIATAVSVALPSAIAVAIAVAVAIPSSSPLAIAVAISLGHHRHRCRRPFPKVVALVWQELYSTNWSKECLPYFILFGQWAVHWSKPDAWPGVKRQWPTPALGGERQALRQATSEGSGWQQWGSRGAAGWKRWLSMGSVVLLCCWGISPNTDGVCDDVLDVVEGIALVRQWLNWHKKKKGLKKYMIQKRKFICKKESERCDTSVY